LKGKLSNDLNFREGFTHLARMKKDTLQPPLIINVVFFSKTRAIKPPTKINQNSPDADKIYTPLR